MPRIEDGHGDGGRGDIGDLDARGDPGRRSKKEEGDDAAIESESALVAGSSADPRWLNDDVTAHTRPIG